MVDNEFKIDEQAIVELKKLIRAAENVCTLIFHPDSDKDVINHVAEHGMDGLEIIRLADPHNPRVILKKKQL